MIVNQYVVVFLIRQGPLGSGRKKFHEKSSTNSTSHALRAERLRKFNLAWNFQSCPYKLEESCKAKTATNLARLLLTLRTENSLARLFSEVIFEFFLDNEEAIFCFF